MDRAYVDEWWGQEPPTKEEFKVYGISFVPIERRGDEILYHFEGPDVGFERAMEDGYFMSVQYGEDEGHGGFEVYESLDEAKSKAPTDLEIELESLKADYDDFGPDGLYAVPFRIFERNYPEFTKSVIKTFLKEMGILTKEELNDPTTYIDYWQTGELITDQDWPCLFEGAVKLSNGEGVQWEKLYKKYYKPVDESCKDESLNEDKTAQQVSAELKQAAPNYEAFVTALKDDAKTAGFLEVIKNNYKKNFGELPEGDDIGVLKKANCSSTEVPASGLIPTQANISMEKSFGSADPFKWGPLGKEGLANSIFHDNPDISGEVIIYDGKYIIDGHHRWSKVFVVKPECPVKCFNVAKIEGVNVADILKGVQLAIAFQRQEVGINPAQGVNLLDHPIDAVKKYVTEQLSTDAGKKILESDFAPNGYDTVEKVAELLSGNVNKLPSAVNNAPDRGYMPQTEYNEPGKDTYAIQTIQKHGIIDVTPDKTAPKKNESLNEGYYLDDDIVVDKNSDNEVAKITVDIQDNGDIFFKIKALADLSDAEKKSVVRKVKSDLMRKATTGAFGPMPNPGVYGRFDESLTEAAESVEVNCEVTPEQIEEFIEESAHASDRFSGSVITFKANNHEVTLTSKFGGGMVVVECDEPHINKWLTDYNINMLTEVVNMLLAGRMPRFKGDWGTSPWGGTDSGQQNLSRWR